MHWILDNMFVRMTAADQLADRIGNQAIQPVSGLLNEKNISTRKYIHALWILQRLGALKPAMLQAAVAISEPVIRLHAMRILAEEKPGEQLLLPLMLKGLEDKDPHVKRAAVELLVKYPGMRSLQLALSVRHNTPGFDTHLLYTSRLCLRNILRNDSIMKQAAAIQWNEQDASYLGDVLMGVPSIDAGIFLFKYVSQYKPADDRAPAIFRHIARFAPYQTLDSMVNIAMKNKRADTVDLVIFKGIQEGIAQRGRKENPQLELWGKSLAESVLNVISLCQRTTAFLP